VILSVMAASVLAISFDHNRQKQLPPQGQAFASDRRRNAFAGLGIFQGQRELPSVLLARGWRFDMR